MSMPIVCVTCNQVHQAGSICERAFTAFDRCDRCGAQAHIRAVFITGDLLFCGHHGREVMDTLVLTAISTTSDLVTS